MCIDQAHWARIRVLHQMRLANSVAAVIERFPQVADSVRRLALENENFRTLCEDYALARQGLENFEARSPSQPSAEVEDYRRLVVELDQEIAHFIAQRPER